MLHSCLPLVSLTEKVQLLDTYAQLHLNHNDSLHISVNIDIKIGNSNEKTSGVSVAVLQFYFSSVL